MTTLHGSPTFRPLYEQIKILITQSLVSGEWRPGEMIPSEIDLAKRYKVSQGTVRKAIDELAAENILVRRQGKGTFVATHTEEKRKYYYLRVFNENGEKEDPISELLTWEKAKADAKMADLLGVRKGAPLIVLTRVLRMNGKPVIYDEIRLSPTVFKGLTAARINEFQGTIYSLYETHYGIRIVQAEERLKAIAAPAKVAEHLGLKAGTPILSIERVALTYGDKPVEWRVSLCNTENHYYLNEIG